MFFPASFSLPLFPSSGTLFAINISFPVLSQNKYFPHRGQEETAKGFSTKKKSQVFEDMVQAINKYQRKSNLPRYYRALSGSLTLLQSNIEYVFST
jgi:hypothetical protein